LEGYFYTSLCGVRGFCFVVRKMGAESIRLIRTWSVYKRERTQFGPNPLLLGIKVSLEVRRRTGVLPFRRNHTGIGHSFLTGSESCKL